MAHLASTRRPGVSFNFATFHGKSLDARSGVIRGIASPWHVLLKHRSWMRRKPRQMLTITPSFCFLPQHQPKQHGTATRAKCTYRSNTAHVQFNGDHQYIRYSTTNFNTMPQEQYHKRTTFPIQTQHPTTSQALYIRMVSMYHEHRRPRHCSCRNTP